MAFIKSVNRLATMVISPDVPYFTAGTMVGAVDLAFSTSSHLEIFKLEFNSDDQDIPMVAQSPSSERFNRLLWGKNGSNSEEYSMGLIASDRVDGTIGLWNPLPLISSEATGDAIVGQLAQHTGLLAIIMGFQKLILVPHL